MTGVWQRSERQPVGETEIWSMNEVKCVHPGGTDLAIIPTPTPDTEELLSLVPARRERK